MDQMEKVDRLRERANVTYEEAKAALEANNRDLLDTMVALEKEGKTIPPQQSDYSTSYEQQEHYIRVQDKVEEQQNSAPKVGRSIRDGIRRFWRICVDNAFCIKRDGQLVFQLPLIVLLLIVLFSWHVSVPVLLIAMLFRFRYSIEGKDDLDRVNDLMESAGNAADGIREGFQKAGNDNAEK